MTSRVITAIDIGTYTTRVVISEILPNRQFPRILGTGASRTSGLHHGYVIKRHDTVKGIRKAVTIAEQKAGIKIQGAYVSLGGIGLKSHSVSSSVNVQEMNNGITYQNIKDCINLAERALSSRHKNLRVLHSEAVNFSLDEELVLGQPLGLFGNKLTCKSMIVSCQEHHFEDILQSVLDAGIEVHDVIATPLANSTISLTQSQKKAGVALVDIGAETVSIAVFEHAHLLSLEVFAIGSTDITNDIALGLQVSLQDAEEIKRGEQSNLSRRYAKSKVDTIIQARLSDIFELVENHLRNVRKNRLLPAGLCITGGGAVLEQVESFAKNYLQLPISVVQHSEMSGSGKRLPDTSWLPVYGVCLAAQQRLYSSNYSHSTSWSEIWSNLKNKFLKLFSHITP